MALSDFFRTFALCLVLCYIYGCKKGRPLEYPAAAFLCKNMFYNIKTG